MDENEARALAKWIDGRSPHWHVEDIFQTATPGKWALLLRHRYDTPTQLYVWDNAQENIRQIREQGILVMHEYNALWG
jgi:hypothetical protein